MNQVGEGPAIDIRGLSKAFGRRRALHELDLQVPWGTVLTVLGPNGSGKTTLLRVLATLARADAGSVKVAGWDIDRDSQLVRRTIGVVTHDALLYDDLTGLENLKLAGKLFGLSDTEGRIDSVSQQLGIGERLDQRVGTLSHGWKKRFSIARALLHDPYILLMDEPESGLDQQALTGLEHILRDASRPFRTVVMTTHSLERGLALGDRLAILAGGRVAYENSTDASHDIEELRRIYFAHTGVGPS